MDEKRKLTVIERTEEKLDSAVKETVKPKISYTNQTNPIFKNLAKFTNEKIGDKWSIKDLLR